MSLSFDIPIFLIALCVGAVAFRWQTGQWRVIILLLSALLSIWVIFFATAPLWVFPAYLVGAAVSVAAITRWAHEENWRYWVAFLIPIMFLVVYKAAVANHLLLPTFVGISYITFRLSYLAWEINGDPDLRSNGWDYFAHAFFLPTLLVGPISPFRAFSEAKSDPVALGEWRTFVARAVLGIAKVTVFAPVANQFGTGGYSDMYHPVSASTAMLGNLLYLYFDFSGLCDIAIAAGCLAGIRIKENFGKPFLQTNIRDFWNHWHISLTHFMRDTVYSPLLMALMRRAPWLGFHLSAAIVSFIMFFLIGIWHGSTINFVLLGLIYGFGVAWATSGPDLLKWLDPLGPWGGVAVKTGVRWAVNLMFMAGCVTLMMLEADQIAKIQNIVTQLFAW